MSPSSITETPHPTNDPDVAAETLWALLSHGCDAAWLEEVHDLRAKGDDIETTLSIWCVALTARLRDPDRKEAAQYVLAKIHHLLEESGGDLHEERAAG